MLTRRRLGINLVAVIGGVALMLAAVSHSTAQEKLSVFAAAFLEFLQSAEARPLEAQGFTVSTPVTTH
jgi:hypothetical protein